MMMATCVTCFKSFARSSDLAQHCKHTGHTQLVSYTTCRLAEAQNWRCCFCNYTMAIERDRPRTATREHVKPRAAGGSDGQGNLVASCEMCNRHRSYMSALGFWRLMAGAPVTLRDLYPHLCDLKGRNVA
jgi:hypothetical protein